jgi:hypothetical protein
MPLVCAVTRWHAGFARSENGVPTASEIAGEGKPQVLLHGFAQARARWHAFDDDAANPGCET